ncbi:M43 family zinc metalloprotease [Flavobacterium sp.]|uniref:M43 family zinc metalloprotease n=1 Tax=Flavobacterium sp. TaxID=239 RepID=UPI0025BFC7C3|nr:M43 family zinc metalloprotease [Flavobacterium sp.]
MKNIIFLLFLSCATLINAQSFVCGNGDETPVNNITPPPNFTYNADNKYVLNVKFHIVYDDYGVILDELTVNGQLVNQFGENEIMEILKDTNVTFNPHNIFFKYKGFDISYNSDVTNGLQNGTSISTLGLHDYNTYNIYFVNYTHIGHAYATNGNTWAVFSFHTMNDSSRMQVLGHELGHCFTLHHVFNLYNTTQCEHVTRDVNSPLYNANVAGDLVHDTPAQSSQPWFANCEYIYNPNSTDCSGEPYVDIIPANYLGYDPYSTCGFHFTPGQVIRMRSHLQSPSMAHVLQTYNTIESLYEPFETIPYGGTIIRSISDNGDGTAEVCRNTMIKHRFQKSFDYVFPDVNADDINTATINDLPEIINTTYTFNVQINQVNPTITNEVFVDCNRQPFCQTEDFVNGLVISTKDLGSMNITIQELNEIQVKDPELFQNLMNEYYHIIRKETESGAVKQTVIYKY